MGEEWVTKIETKKNLRLQSHPAFLWHLQTFSRTRWWSRSASFNVIKPLGLSSTLGFLSRLTKPLHRFGRATCSVDAALRVQVYMVQGVNLACRLKWAMSGLFTIRSMVSALPRMTSKFFRFLRGFFRITNYTFLIIFSQSFLKKVLKICTKFPWIFELARNFEGRIPYCARFPTPTPDMADEGKKFLENLFSKRTLSWKICSTKLPRKFSPTLGVKIFYYMYEADLRFTGSTKSYGTILSPR